MKRIMVCSGKGGVGKTTISISIAKILNEYGRRVGILDVDIDTPNVPEFMNLERTVELSDEGIIPKNVDGIEVMSVGLLADTDIAIMWDGGRRAMTINQMFKHVDWNCEVLVVDTPPGTTDEVMTVISKFSPDIIIIVTTGHLASISDVKRTLAMLNILNVEKNLLGVIKNLSSVSCPVCSEKIPLFESEDSDDGNMIKNLTIACVPYTNDYTEIKEALMPVIDKLTEVL